MRQGQLLTSIGLVAFATAFPALAGDTPSNGATSAFVEVDYAKIERKIAREPKYVAEPRYALFVFDAAGKFKVWAVLDKSKPDSPVYDVLYFDRTGDGDLTDPGDRVELAKADRWGGRSFSLGNLEVPGTSVVHKDLRFSMRDQRIYFSMLWAGKESIAGGWGGAQGSGTAFAKSPDAAPVLRPTAEGALAFAWVDPKIALKRTEETRIYLVAGNRGSGPDTLCAVSDNFLVPGKDRIFMTVVGKDADGKEVRSRHEIKNHC